MPLKKRVANIFSEALQVDPSKFSIDMAPDSVSNWDSLGHMRLVSTLEQEFNVQFKIEEIMEMASPAKIIEILNAKGVTA